MSYSLICSSVLSNEERKNIVRKFKSNQRKREIYNKCNDHYLQLEPAKKKQRYSLMDRAKKDELLETCAKRYKEIDMSKKKQMLENRRKKYKEMGASKKKQMRNKKAVKSRKSYDSMDCEKKEKYLNAIRNQSAIAQQNKKISKLRVDVCISQFCQKIKEGPYYVCTVCNRMLYRKSVLIFNKQKYVNCNIQNIFTEKLSFDSKEYICKTCHSKVIRGKVPCQAVYNDMFVGDIPTELSTLEKLEQIPIAQRIVFEIIVVMPKGQQRKIKGAICNVPVECDKTCQTLPRPPESSGIILLKLKRKLQFRGHVYYQAVRPEIVLNALNWLKANNELYIKKSYNSRSNINS